jgi:hypothetical protein
MTKQIEQPAEQYDSIFSLIVRTFWMLFGNVIPIVSVVLIFQRKDWKFHTADMVFWGSVAALVLARYLDIKLYNGLTAAGQPASMSHWRKYTVILLLCSTVVWVIAHAINYLVVNK